MDSPAVVEYGDILTLTCITSGGPNNMFQWIKDGINLEESTSILNIMRVTAADGGFYGCVVNNAAGSSSTNTTIYGRSSLSLNTLHYSTISI